MTLLEVMEMAKNALEVKTGLVIEVEQMVPGYYRLHATANGIKLGSTSVIETVETGVFLVGGSNTGAFIQTGVVGDLSEAMKADFQAIEDQANG